VLLICDVPKLKILVSAADNKFMLAVLSNCILPDFFSTVGASPPAAGAAAGSAVARSSAVPAALILTFLPDSMLMSLVALKFKSASE
jgi:hypothetical protein